MKLITLALFAVSSVALAQSADPTRPPAAWLAPVAEAQPGEDSGGLRLQSVLMRQGARPVAVIGGQTVALGGRVGEAKLIRLNEREAVLQGADGVTHLYLTPDVEKQMIEMPKSRKKGNSGPVKGLP
jgi:MSHA biogenesis protein MshK